jgi:hypothetical protein
MVLLPTGLMTGMNLQNDLAAGVPPGQLVVGLAHPLQRVDAVDRDDQLPRGRQAGEVLPDRG